ncbi:MAG TPA: hypothetical protein VGP85_01085 [Pyrinomonadaceae bacterium]|nr:hypothetical protein [Pyrinomonadaceae bacterium]
MTRLRVLFLTAMLLGIAMCLSSSSLPQRVAAQGASKSTVPVYTTPDGFILGNVIEGAEAGLVRNPTGLTTNVHTFAGPGAYTLWWVVFNHPEDCQTYFCTYDEPDLVIGATGHPINASELANFSARLNVNGPYNNFILFEGPDPTLSNPAGALITLVIRYHGPELASGGSDEFRNYFAGCPDGGAPCEDRQLVVFPGDCSGLCLIP